VRGDRVLVGGGQCDVAVLLVGELSAAVGQPLGSDLGAVGGLAGGEGEPVDLGLAGRGPRPGGSDLPG
jgi:hypothetical protein